MKITRAMKLIVLCVDKEIQKLSFDANAYRVYGGSPIMEKRAKEYDDLKDAKETLMGFVEQKQRKLFS